VRAHTFPELGNDGGEWQIAGDCVAWPAELHDTGWTWRQKLAAVAPFGKTVVKAAGVRAMGDPCGRISKLCGT
jgi:hypothetical protein